MGVELRDTESAIAVAEKAALVFPLLDDIPYMNAARLSLYTSQRKDRNERIKALHDASSWAAIATGFNEHNSSAWRLLGQIHRELGRFDKGFFGMAVEDFARAVELDPSDARLRLEYAEVLLDAGKKREANEQINKAEEINGRLKRFNPTSAWRFGPAEGELIEQLRQKAGR